MTGQVKTKAPTEIGRNGYGVSDGLHDHTPPGLNKNTQHSDALRLALGSILAPKRPYSPPSRPSTPGTSSPALSFSFSSHPSSPSLATPPLPPTPPHPTPTQSAHGRFSDPHMYGLHMYSHSQSPPHSHGGYMHAPSPLGIMGQGDHAAESGLAPSTESHPSSTSSSANTSMPHTPIQEIKPEFPACQPPSESTDHALSTTAPAANSQDEVGPTGSPVPPRAKFIETLQSKNPWEALIHGSFS